MQHGFIAPELDEDSRAWWEALAEHRLLLPRCRDCERTWFPPTPGCPHCGGTSVELVESSGRGRVYSWVVVNRALAPAFTADVPYTILAVDLEEGARMFGRLVGGRGEALAAGAEVRAEFYEVEGRVLVGFAL
ncbi:MAG TPA: Zn-ribbon domain-containing OB-fold protein [Candidatus Dormibacteraeota bacterium]|nr:Zn-ribbon domain-containing OB-fold protein [Candidatus Dormibacteraeota bacterium]